eukprot:m.271527 g.271527  ORF g.271527 m.271527 type:complete len:50 (-) comp86373_c0_seq1:80-229(-)
MLFTQPPRGTYHQARRSLSDVSIATWFLCVVQDEYCSVQHQGVVVFLTF